jgi:hypothetical protein
MNVTEFNTSLSINTELSLGRGYEFLQNKGGLAILNMLRKDIVESYYKETVMNSNEKPKQHKHHDLIVAWAKGAVIEERTQGQDEHGPAWYPWEEVRNPHWYVNNEYRIKPTPKPDIIYWGILNYLGISGPIFRECSQEHSNIKVVFDGETHKIKEVIVL